MLTVTTPSIPVSGDLAIGGSAPLALIAGPCVIEDADTCLRMADRLQSICAARKTGFIFKASFDKANRSSIGSYRGPGLEQGLKVLARVKQECGVPVLSDIHLPEQAAPAAEVLDIIQIPAFLCRQTDILVAAAATGRVVNVKKGQFMSPDEMGNVITKVRSAGNQHVCITERGTTFGYNRLINDFTAIPQMRAMGTPVIFDATHSVQRPGGLGDRSGGAAEFVPALARAAAAVGIDALFIETHPAPADARSDGPNMIPLDEVDTLLAAVTAIHNLIRQ